MQKEVKWQLLTRPYNEPQKMTTPPEVIKSHKGDNRTKNRKRTTKGQNPAKTTNTPIKKVVWAINEGMVLNLSFIPTRNTRIFGQGGEHGRLSQYNE